MRRRSIWANGVHVNCLDGEAFTALIEAVRERYEIPGLAAALRCGEVVRRASSGVLNVSTRVGVTDDSVFQIGSITKVFTGTLVMQLVDEGALELDAPIRRYLPALHIAHEPISDAVTVRRLLTHTSGIVGDFFVDTGRNDDATARYLDRCSELAYVTEPGRYFSYCNSGFNVLGGLIEAVSKQTWAQRLRQRLLDPLEIVALVDPQDAPRYRTAVGHVLDEAGFAQLTPTCFLPRASEAAGGRLAMSATALLAFAKLHLRGGLAPNGQRLVSAQACRAMRNVEVRMPLDVGEAGGWGLSWQINDGWRPQAIGHDGTTVGQAAFLRVIPEWDAAVALVTNVGSGGPHKAFDDVFRAAAGAMGETVIPTSPAANAAATIAADRFVGAYETHMNRYDVTADGGQLRATVSQRNGESVGAVPVRKLVLRPIGDDRFLVEDEPHGKPSVAGFVEFDADGKARFLFSGLRLAERVAAPATCGVIGESR